MAITCRAASKERKNGHQTRAKVPRTTKASFITSTIGYFRLRHFPRRWLKKAGAKYRLICSISSCKIYRKTMGYHNLNV